MNDQMAIFAVCFFLMWTIVPAPPFHSPFILSCHVSTQSCHFHAFVLLLSLTLSFSFFFFFSKKSFPLLLRSLFLFEMPIFIQSLCVFTSFYLHPNLFLFFPSSRMLLSDKNWNNLASFLFHSPFFFVWALFSTHSTTIHVSVTTFKVLKIIFRKMVMLHVKDVTVR